MANIADGWLEISPVSAELANSLTEKILSSGKAFNFAHEARIAVDKANLKIMFTGRWTCESAWDLINELLADSTYAFNAELVQCSMEGLGDEPDAEYFERVRKLPGEAVLCPE